MSLEIRRSAQDRILELGGGENPLVNPECRGGNDVTLDLRQCNDSQGRPCVDIVADFNQPLPLRSEEFDGIVSVFCLEHVSWRQLPTLLAEMYRVTKPGARLTLILPNTEEQVKRILSGKCAEHTDGEFVECSRILFGDQNYQGNFHSCYFSPGLVIELLRKAGFKGIVTSPYGEIQTDMLVQAVKPAEGEKAGVSPFTESQREALKKLPEAEEPKAQFIPTTSHPPMETTEERAAVFNRLYFEGTGKWGGYGGGGYRDFPAHEVTAKHILMRRPKSVLELGAARGYVLKRLEDAGVTCVGLDISKHCYMTRVCNSIFLSDLCTEGYPLLGSEGSKFDLCFSVGVLDHIPEKYIYEVVKMSKHVATRQLHGIGFKPNEDKTRVLVRPREWWMGLDWGPAVEIVDKDELEAGTFPAEVAKGDGKVKLNIGSFTTMFHHGWTNIDLMDLSQWATNFGYNYRRHDVRSGLPYPTGGVDLIFSCHMLEHLTYQEGLAFLKECRRVIRKDGAMRILVPDTELLNGLYVGGGGKFGLLPNLPSLDEFDEINETCANSPTKAGKLHAILYSGDHKALYDTETLGKLLEEAGFVVLPTEFRCSGGAATNSQIQIIRETMDMLPCLTLFMDAVPRIEE